MGVRLGAGVPEPVANVGKVTGVTGVAGESARGRMGLKRRKYPITIGVIIPTAIRMPSVTLFFRLKKEIIGNEVIIPILSDACQEGFNN